MSRNTQRSIAHPGRCPHPVGRWADRVLFHEPSLADLAAECQELPVP